MARKVHDQIKAVLAAWNTWTTGCPCNCKHCVELDRKLADLVNAWDRITRMRTAETLLPPGTSPVTKTLPKRQRAPVVVEAVLVAWMKWRDEIFGGQDSASCADEKTRACSNCLNLHDDLNMLKRLIKAGPGEE